MIIGNQPLGTFAMNTKIFTTPAAFAALAAALLFTPATSTTVMADPAPNPCATDVFSPECAKQMAYNVCIAGGGTPEGCKPKAARGPVLGVKAIPERAPVVNTQHRR